MINYNRQEKSSLKQKLKNKEMTIGSWITLGSTGLAEILANSGFDWLVVDLEHTNNGFKITP